MWYSSGGYTPTRRVSISLDGNGASANYSVTIPAQLDDFWNEIDTSGNELRVTDADGVTVLTYDLSGFSKTNRTGTIRIGAYTAGSGVEQLFLYYGMSGASSAAGSPATSSPRNGYIDLGSPKGRIIPWRPERPGATAPEEQFTKGSGEQKWLWFDLGSFLHTASAPVGSAGNKHPEWEEARLVTYAIYSGASAQASMVDATLVRFVGGRYFRVLVKAGTTAVDYTLVATLTTTYPTQAAGQTAEKRVEVVVKNVAE